MARVDRNESPLYMVSSLPESQRPCFIIRLCSGGGEIVEKIIRLRGICQRGWFQNPKNLCVERVEFTTPPIRGFF